MQKGKKKELGKFQCTDYNELRKKGITKLHSRMKISVSTDISVLGFYGYIGYIEDISMDIFT